MKTFFLVGLLLSISLSIFSQRVELSLSNPLPRAGDRITLNYSIYPDDHPFFTFEEIDAPRKGNCKDQKTQIAKGSYTKNQGIDTVGVISLGPFQFTDGEAVYTTEPINIEIFPQLPNVQEGLWCSFIQQAGKYYLVVEQRVPGKVMQQSPTVESMKAAPTRVKLNKTKFDTSDMAIKSTRTQNS